MDYLDNLGRFRAGLFETLGLALTVTACGNPRILTTSSEGGGEGTGGSGETTTHESDSQTSTAQTSGSGSTVGPTSDTADTGAGETSVDGGGTTGGAFECPGEPPPAYTKKYVCFDRPPELASCEECDDACATQGSWGSLCDRFCCPEDVAVMCGPDPEPEVADQCCYFYAVSVNNICEGRPLVVDGMARVAPLRCNAQWHGDATPSVEGLDGATRIALARAWRDDATMEHASVASFARFVLQLLEVGAPPRLVLDAQRAIADEIEHARTCFALAAAYDGKHLGPAAFDTGVTTGPSDLPALAAATVLEGCINETTAAVLADVAAAGTEDPTVCASLRRIAEDEARHAALAWRTVQWALGVGGEPVRRAVQRAFISGLSAPLSSRTPPRDVDPQAMRARGRLAPDEELEVVRAVRRHIVAPCADALLGACTA